MMKRAVRQGIAVAAIVGPILAGLTLETAADGRDGKGVSRPTAPQTSTPALTGKVTSAAEGAMEGVLVSAKRTGANMTVTVVSNADGLYSFPRDRLEPGLYTLSIRAIGYVLPPHTRVAEVSAQTRSVKDLHLEEANELEKAYQLTSAEWLWSYPLRDEMKYLTLRDCTRCHSHQKIAMSTYDVERLAYVMQRMVYTSGSTPLSFQLPPARVADWGRGDGVMAGPPSPFHRLQAQAVAQVNLSNGFWQYPLKTLPRPTGKDTRVIYTTYDLSRVLAKPHDTQMGPDGWIYYNDFNANVIGKLNPETGESVEWSYAYAHDEASFTPVGSRTLNHDGEGRFYIGTLRQGLVVFDSRAETFEYYPDAGMTTMATPESMHVDGHAWNYSIHERQLYRVRFHGNGEWTRTAIAALDAYAISVDSKNNVYGAGRTSREIWRVDARTLEVTSYPIPDEPRGAIGGLGGGIRRGLVDGQGRLWWGGFDGGFVGMLDPRLPPGEEIQLQVVPVPWFQPYIAENDDAGYTWTGSISGDRVARLNETSGEWSIYLLPAETNLRHIRVQRPESGGLSSLWVGMNHQARIVHIQPLAP